MTMKKIAMCLIMSLLVSLLGLVPAAAEGQSVTVTENFQTEAVGSYTKNMRSFSAPVTAEIVEAGGNRWLKLSVPQGSTGTPGYYFVSDSEYLCDKVTVSFRVRFTDFVNEPGKEAWPATFAVRYNIVKGDGSTDNQSLLFTTKSGFVTNFAGIKADGGTVKAGSAFYTGAVENQWLTYRITFDKADETIFSEIRNETGTLLGSVKVSEVKIKNVMQPPFTGEDRLKELYVYAPYLSSATPPYGTVEIDDVVALYEGVANPPGPQTYALTGEIGEHGSVTVNGEPFANGDSIQLAKDADIAVAITPEEGYEIDQVKLGETALVAAGTVNATMPEANTTLTVTFRAKPTEPTIAGDAAISFFREVNGVPTAFVYGKISDYYNPSLDAECGMKVWVDGDKEHTLTLSSRVNESTPRKAQPNLGFAIQVYGSAITAENRYKFQPYVGGTLGEEQTLEFQ